MRRWPARAALLCTVLILPTSGSGPAFAWTAATRARMLNDALKVTPPALNAILEHYRADLNRGMAEPSRRESEEVHYQLADGSAGLAATAVAAKEQETLALLQRKHALRRFTFEMGALAHLTSDISFPLNARESDPREPLYREPYRAYIESMLGKIPFVLDPAPAPRLDAGDTEGYLMDSARRAGANYERIGPAFKDDGTPRSPDALDERSMPFGIASLAYSQAVNDIVRLWDHVWRLVEGDFSGQPYRQEAPLPAGSPGKEP